MLTGSRLRGELTFVSASIPEITTQDPHLARTIAWADANPFVWKIVTGTRSRAFGRNSCEYLGWAQRCNAPEAILERARQFHACVDPNVTRGTYHRSTQIWGWRARFTFEHFEDQDFASGFLQRFDGRYDRDCMTLDYTSDLFGQVVRNFMQWADSTPGASPTDTIKLNGVVLPPSFLKAARLLRCTIWDPPSAFVTKRALMSSLR